MKQANSWLQARTMVNEQQTMINKQPILCRNPAKLACEGHERRRLVALALLSAILLGLATVRPAAGQLAITEAMSAASTNILADFWELTNFGTNDINLAGFI